MAMKLNDALSVDAGFWSTPVRYRQKDDYGRWIQSCPCDDCARHADCARTGHECRTYRHWVQYGAADD